MSKVFGDFDITDFWERSDHNDREYVDAPPTDETLAAVEHELGYKLPAAYIELMRQQNGGVPAKKHHRVKAATSWSADRVTVHSLASIGSEKDNALCGAYGNDHWLTEWGYPEIGVYFADSPSAGHDMLCLDYSECGPRGEPRVVHVDQERDYKVTPVAPNFEAFIRGLEGDEAFA